MPRDTMLTAALARMARFPFWAMGGRSFVPPKKALILKPCCLSQVMLATPLLAVLSDAFPDTRFDWAVGDWASPAVISNPRITKLIPTGPGGLESLSLAEMHDLIERIRQESYDTCFIPSRSSLLAYVAWRARIPQRVGLLAQGRGFAHTVAIKTPSRLKRTEEIYLSLARAVGIESVGVGPEFYPPDADRRSVTRRLNNELAWAGDVPLVVLHPGGGSNPLRKDLRKQWPLERFVRLGNHFTRGHGALVLLVGAAEDRARAADISGLLSASTANWAGQINLAELGALCEVADLYVGNDAGPTHIAAAVGCPTLAIFGPSDPAISAPRDPQGVVKVLWHKPDGLRPFSWDRGVSVEEAIRAAEEMLALRERGDRKGTAAV